MRKALLLALCFCTIVPVASAHHGFTAHFYPDRVIRIEGTVRRFDFINPHGFLHIDSADADGNPVVYVCDLQARNILIRHGADASLFKVGEAIVVEAFEARRNPLHCEFAVAYFADGSSFTMRSTDKARSKFPENITVPIEEGIRHSIFGTWIRPGMDGDLSGRGERSGQDTITAAGRAAVAEFDLATDNPVLRCEGSSPVHTWGPPGLATSIRQEDNKVIIYHESMDTTRTVYLDVSEHPPDLQPSDMGHSYGRFEGGYLLIDTAVFTAGVLVGTTLHTDQLTLQERISVQEETGRLLIEWTATDPEYYVDPLTGSQLLQPTNKELIRYDCIPGSPLE